MLSNEEVIEADMQAPKRRIAVLTSGGDCSYDQAVHFPVKPLKR